MDHLGDDNWLVERLDFRPVERRAGVEVDTTSLTPVSETGHLGSLRR